MFRHPGEDAGERRAPEGFCRKLPENWWIFVLLGLIKSPRWIRGLYFQKQQRTFRVPGTTVVAGCQANASLKLRCPAVLHCCINKRAVGQKASPARPNACSSAGIIEPAVASGPATRRRIPKRPELNMRPKYNGCCCIRWNAVACNRFLQAAVKFPTCFPAEKERAAMAEIFLDCHWFEKD